MSTVADLQALYQSYYQQLSTNNAEGIPPQLQAQLNLTGANPGGANTPWTAHAQVDQVSLHYWDALFPAYILIEGSSMRFYMSTVYSDNTYTDPSIPSGALPQAFSQFPFSAVGLPRNPTGPTCTFLWTQNNEFIIEILGSVFEFSDSVANSSVQTAGGLLYGYINAPGITAAFAFSLIVRPSPPLPVVR